MLFVEPSQLTFFVLWREGGKERERERERERDNTEYIIIIIIITLLIDRKAEQLMSTVSHCWAIDSSETCLSIDS